MTVAEITEIEVNGRTFHLQPVGPEVFEAGNVVAAAIAQSMGKSQRWAEGFFWGNLELAMELAITIWGISELDEE